MASGSWIKVIGAAPGRFPLALLGQGLVGAAQVFELAIPARVAALWFGPGELSTACAIGILGNEVGAAIGFILTPIMVQLHDNPEDIGSDLKFMLYVSAGVSTTVSLLIIFLFKIKPEFPPSPAQVLERCSENTVTLKNFFGTLWELLTNRNYLLIFVSNGISIGVLNVVCTVLNPVILRHFPNGQEFAGRVGLIIMICGILGLLLFGILLDKTHKFKETTLGVFILQALTNAAFAFALRAENTTLVYITASIFGFFLFGYLTLSIEMSVEVTYPASECTMGGLLLIPGNLLGCLMTIAFNWAMERWGDFEANMLMTASLLFGVILTVFIKKDYRRLAANTVPVKS